MDKVYNEVISKFYGINCNNCDKDNGQSYWIDLIIKNLNINSECRTNLQILSQSIK